MLPDLYNLSDVPQRTPDLVALLKSTWPNYYGNDGPGNATEHVGKALSQSQLPQRFLALFDDTLVGTIAIARFPIGSHAHLSPGLIGLAVPPTYRRQGIATLLVKHASVQTKTLGYDQVFMATEWRPVWLREQGWQLIEESPSVWRLNF